MKHKILALCCIAAVLLLTPTALANDAPPGAKKVGTVNPMEGDGPTVTKWHWSDVSDLHIDTDPERITPEEAATKEVIIGDDDDNGTDRVDVVKEKITVDDSVKKYVAVGEPHGGVYEVEVVDKRLTSNESDRKSVEIEESNDDGEVGICVVGAGGPCNGDP